MNVFPEIVVERELDGLELDDAVARALGLRTMIDRRGVLRALIVSKGNGNGADGYRDFSPSRDWAAAGIALDLCKPMAIVPVATGGFVAWIHGEAAKIKRTEGSGRSMLLASMRAIAAMGPGARREGV